MNNRDGMPKPKAILSFWADKLIEENGKYWLDVEREYDCSEKEKTNICFACGCNVGTQRAHIIPLRNGGSNEAFNLHLLCNECHTESEFIEQEEPYWVWFNFKSPSNSGSYLRLMNKVKIAIGLLEKSDSDLFFDGVVIPKK